MQPVNAILELRRNFVLRLRDAAAWRTIRDDRRTRVGQLPLDIRRYLIEPYFRDLRRDRLPQKEAARQIAIWEAKYGPSDATRCRDIFRDIGIPDAEGDVIGMKIHPTSIVIQGRDWIRFHEYDPETAAIGRLLRHLDSSERIVYVGGGIYATTADKYLDSQTRYISADVSANVPPQQVLRWQIVKPRRVLPCGLLYAEGKATAFIIDIATGDYRRVVRSKDWISSDYGGGYLCSTDPWTEASPRLHMLFM